MSKETLKKLIELIPENEQEHDELEAITLGKKDISIKFMLKGPAYQPTLNLLLLENFNIF